MNSSIQLYSYGEEPVRVIMLGDPPAAWFVAKDVCDILELSNVTEALRPLDDDELSSVSLKSGGQGKAGGNYEPTDYGSQYAVMLDINKWHKKGSPMRQLKWTTGILDELTPYFN